MRAGRENLVEDLARAFPAEAAAIHAWLADVDRAASISPLRVMDAALPSPIRRAAWAAMAGRLALGNMSLRDYLARRFADPRLRAVVSARWGDHSLPPSQCAFLAHAVITRHYLDGAVYPVGSGASIAAAMSEVIAGAGGQLRIRAEVAQILVRNGRAIGVRLASGEEILAPGGAVTRSDGVAAMNVGCGGEDEPGRMARGDLTPAAGGAGGSPRGPALPTVPAADRARREGASRTGPPSRRERCPAHAPP